MRRIKQLKLETSNLLLNACNDGDLEIVKEQIEQGFAEATEVDDQGNTPLHIAALKGHAQIVKYLLTKNPYLESENKKGCRPLHLAAESGSIEVVRLLTEAGANLDAYDDYGNSPLHQAARQGSAVTTAYLNGKYARGTWSPSGKTPWGLAMEEGHVGVIRVLGRDHARWIECDPSTTLFYKFSNRHYTVLFKAGLLPENLFFQAFHPQELLLLFVAREKNPESPFRKDFLPLDLFKEIYRAAVRAIRDYEWDRVTAPYFLYDHEKKH